MDKETEILDGLAAHGPIKVGANVLKRIRICLNVYSLNIGISQRHVSVVHILVKRITVTCIACGALVHIGFFSMNNAFAD